MRVRTAAAALTAVSALVAIGAAVAWACTATTFIKLAPTQSALPGNQLTARVLAGPELASGPVELRLLNSDGPALATATATRDIDFSLPMTVPDLRPGVHYLALVSGGKIVTRAEFEVLGTQASPDGGRAVTSARPAPSRGPSPVTVGVAATGAGLLALSAFGLVTSKRRRACASVTSG